MSLTTLPDDALLLVLGRLETQELLQCRGVCRRLRDAALHPHLWRKRRLLFTSSVPLTAATLRLAPCLGRLWLDFDDDDDDAEYFKLGMLLASTNCGISTLRVDALSYCTLAVSTALMRQAALGRLKIVSLRLQTQGNDVNDLLNLRLLLEQLLHTRGLTTIRVTVDPYHPAPASPSLHLAKAAEDDAVPASLRRLVYNWQDGTLPSYLRWHAETLQVVHLLWTKQSPAGTAALLGALPRLCDLQCPALEDMPALLRCPALKRLYLSLVDVDEATRTFLRGVQLYLRQAVAGPLEIVTLHYDDRSPVCVDAVNLVLSLAGPGSGIPSSLRSLTLSYGDVEDAPKPQPQLAPLAAILHRLNHLVSLDLGGPPTPEFLEALDGRVLPKLERLRVYLMSNPPGCPEGWDGGCPHAWAHGDEPRALMRRYPRLHIVLRPDHMDGCLECISGCDECKCAFCEANSCHFLEFTDYLLFSHPEDEHCSQDHDPRTEIRVDL